jgi:hypothetical protein
MSAANDHISVFKFARRIGTHYFIVQERATRGVYGPVTKPPGKTRPLMLSVTELQKRGLFPTNTHKEVAAKIFAAIDAVLTASTLSTSEQVRIFHSFLPVLNSLMPADTAIEGKPQSTESPLGVTPR